MDPFRHDVTRPKVPLIDQFRYDVTSAKISGNCVEKIAGNCDKRDEEKNELTEEHFSDLSFFGESPNNL